MAPDAEPQACVAIVGAGMRSRHVWQRLVANHPWCSLVGVADPSGDALAASVAEGHVTEEACFREPGEMLTRTRPDAVIVCPIIEAHGAAVGLALEAGAHVLVEKPFVTDVAEAERLTQSARSSDLRLGVVQNWRTKSAGVALREAIASGRIGEVSHIAFRYLRDREKPHLPDYLFDEEDPVLWAMGIHHLDLFRYALNDEIIAAEGSAWTPTWSRYRQPSIVDLTLRTQRGAVISYVASFSSRNAHLPQESLQVEGELGTISNESQYFEPPLILSLRDHAEAIDLTADVLARGEVEQYAIADAAILGNFVSAIGDPSVDLIASAEDNIGTLRAIDLARRAIKGK